MNLLHRNAINELSKEVERAAQKWPKNDDLITALSEELGELSQALLHMKYEKTSTHKDVYKEAIQTACVAIRIAAEGDSSFPYDPEKGFMQFTE